MLVSMVATKRAAELVRNAAVTVWIPITETGFPNIPALAPLEKLCRMSSFNRSALGNYAIIGEGGSLLGAPDCRQYDYSKPLQPPMVDMMRRQLEDIVEARKLGRGFQALEQRAQEAMSHCADTAITSVLAMSGL